MPISDYSTSAASNTTLGGIAIGPGMERGKVNDAIQQLMADIARHKFMLGAFVTVKDAPYNAVGDGATSGDGAAIQAAMDAVSAAGGGFVYVPEGTYLSAIKLQIPNRVRLIGQGYSCTTIKATNTFSQTSLITNKDHDGTQQYAGIIGIGFDGNKSGGAVCSSGVVHICSVFEGSIFDDVLATEGSSYGMYVQIANGFGPVEFGSLWCLSNNEGNFFCEVTGTGNAANGINIESLTAEHQNTGKTSVRFKNTTASNILIGVKIGNLHVEQNRTGASTKCLVIDGVTNFTVEKCELLAGAPSSHTGVEITNNSYNQYIEINHVSNPNLIQTALSDLKNSVTFGAVNVPYYGTPDVGKFVQGQQTLSYSASITPDLSLGNYCMIAVSNTSAFTINAPTNAAHIQDIYFEIVNLSGGAMGAITWNGTAFPYVSWTNPANGFRKVIHFHRRSSTAFAQAAAITPDF